ncbi:phosphatase PAP2 family protein [Variovorax sp. KK3]|uniref:phosphatase PAP2 family protein n=1 Tax=Variovorax sp. KK3 TaxID=1855728 RepID=UPI0009F8F2FD|nr:phosphatase PAP2 family protein [Variovorax sp. KK3]
MTHPDVALFLWMSAGALPPSWLVDIASAIARGGPWVTAAIMGWVAFRMPRERSYLMALLAMAGISSLTSHAIASMIGLQRPFVLGLSPAYIAHAPSAALPSTHATVMGLIALGALCRPGLRGWFPVTAIAALVTGWARVYVGVHFPSDILAGFVLSGVLLVAFLGAQWLTRRLVIPTLARLDSTPGEEGRPAG